MNQLTTKELSAIEDQLYHEQNLISKFQSYADSSFDTQLKNRYNEAASKHQKHYNALYSLINQCL